MKTLREAAEALLYEIDTRADGMPEWKALAALRSALAQPEEPGEPPCPACNDTGVRMYGGGPCASGCKPKEPGEYERGWRAGVEAAAKVCERPGAFSCCRQMAEAIRSLAPPEEKP